MGYHYNLAQLISLQVVDGDSVLFLLWLYVVSGYFRISWDFKRPKKSGNHELKWVNATDAKQAEQTPKYVSLLHDCTYNECTERGKKICTFPLHLAPLCNTYMQCRDIFIYSLAKLSINHISPFHDSWRISSAPEQQNWPAEQPL